MREVLVIGVGQCGLQITNQLWEILAMEHEIGFDGSDSMKGQREDIAHEIYFEQLSTGKFRPRALFFDMEDTPCSDIQSGKLKGLIDEDISYSCGNEGAASNFARGRYGKAGSLLAHSLSQFRYAVESCDSCAGIMHVHSASGGTGSGYLSAFAHGLTKFPGANKVAKFSLCVEPSPNISTSTTAPYNSLLCMKELHELYEVNVGFDNEALYKRCCELMPQKWCPTYKNVNEIIANFITSFTAGLRFDGENSSQINDFQTNMIPFKDLSMLLCSYAPLSTPHRSVRNSATVDDITFDIFKESSNLCSVNPMDGTWLSCALLYRGDDMRSADINKAIQQLKVKYEPKFVSWSPTGFKISNSSAGIQGSTYPENSVFLNQPNSCASFCNNTVAKDLIGTIANKFDRLYSKQAFVCWYLKEGMEESEFIDARDYVEGIMSEYELCKFEQTKDE